MTDYAFLLIMRKGWSCVFINHS